MSAPIAISTLQDMHRASPSVLLCLPCRPEGLCLDATFGGVRYDDHQYAAVGVVEEPRVPGQPHRRQHGAWDVDRVETECGRFRGVDDSRLLASQVSGSLRVVSGYPAGD